MAATTLQRIAPVSSTEELYNSRLLETNPWPTESFIREVYDYFIEKQRLEESERYLRTLGGMVGLSYITSSMTLSSLVC